MSQQSDQLPAARTPVLFVSGAGLPAWIWDEVRAALPDGVQSAVARRPDGAQARLADYADAAAQAPWPTFVVVAHSSGGVVAAELLSRHPRRVTGILGVSAVVPRANRSFVSTMPIPARLVLGLVLRLAGTRPPAKAVRAGLASGVPQDIADRIVTDFSPESLRLYLDTTSTRELPPTRAYVLTTEDRELTTSVQRRSADELSATWTEELPTGHLPMLEDPTRLNQVVQRLLATVDS